MGEAEVEQEVLVRAVQGALVEQGEEAAELSIATPGGRFQVRWDEGGSATALGQLVHFAEFLEVSGLFEGWVEGCPMVYTSPNAPEVRGVLGTWLLSILNGQRRYANVTGLRGDAVAPQILGMKKIVGDESLRRGLAHLDRQRQEGLGYHSRCCALVAKGRPLARPCALHHPQNPRRQTQLTATTTLPTPAFTPLPHRIMG